jgi:hypothetical protein
VARTTACSCCSSITGVLLLTQHTDTLPHAAGTPSNAQCYPNTRPFRPFLLQAKLSMTQMGIFTMSGYPYSFKLLWSPIVDSVYSAAFGRRKSWIVPVQLSSAALLMCSADWIQRQYEAGAVGPLTVLFFFFVLLAATQVRVGGWVRLGRVAVCCVCCVVCCHAAPCCVSCNGVSCNEPAHQPVTTAQDIAVDGWALTLLPPHHIEYASTCQTLGMNTGEGGWHWVGGGGGGGCPKRQPASTVWLVSSLKCAAHIHTPTTTQ